MLAHLAPHTHTLRRPAIGLAAGFAFGLIFAPLSQAQDPPPAKDAAPLRIVSAAQAEDALVLAAALLREGALAAAERELQQVRKDQPDWARQPAVLLHLAWCLQRQGRREDLWPVLAEMRQRFPKAPETAAALVIEVEERLASNEAAKVPPLIPDAALQAAEAGNAERLRYARARAYEASNQLPQAAADYRALAALPLIADAPYRRLARLQLSQTRLAVPATQVALALKELSESAVVPPEQQAEALYRLALLQVAQPATAPAARLTIAKLLALNPTGPQAWPARLMLAELHLQQQAFNEVLTTLAEPDGEAPHLDARTRLLRGLALLELNEPEKAKVLCEAILKDQANAPEAPVAQRVLAQCLLRLKQPEAAVALITPLLGTKPPHPLELELQSLLAVALTDLQRPEEAAKLLETLLQRPELNAADKARVRRELALQLAQLGQAGPAAALWRDLAADAQNPEAPAACLNAARLSTQAGELPLATRDYQGFLKRYPKHELVPQALLELALLESRKPEAGEAAALLAKLVQDYPQFPQIATAWSLRAQLERRANRPEGARDALIQALRDPKVPGRASLVWELGELHYHLRQEPEAAQVWAELLPEAGDAPELAPEMLDFLARLYQRRRAFALAERAWRQLAKQPAAPARLSALLGLGELKFSRQDWQAAVPLLDQALPLLDELSQQNPPPLPIEALQQQRSRALAIKGECLRQLKETQLAHNLFADALQINARDEMARGLARYGLAELYLADGRLADARQQALYVTMVEKNATQRPAAMRLLITIYLREGETDAARRQMQQLQKHFPAEWALWANDPELKKLQD